MSAGGPFDLFARWLTGASVVALASIALGACGDIARLPVSAGTGPTPTLPAPQKTLIPTVNIAPAKGWPAGAAPQPAPGTAQTDPQRS